MLFYEIISGNKYVHLGLMALRKLSLRVAFHVAARSPGIARKNIAMLVRHYYENSLA